MSGDLLFKRLMIALLVQELGEHRKRRASYMREYNRRCAEKEGRNFVPTYSRIPYTAEEAKAKRRESQLKYNKTDKAKARLARYNAAHPEKRKATASKYNRSDKAKERHKRYALKHPERRTELARKYREKNREHVNRVWRAYRAANRDKVRKWRSDAQKRMYATAVGRLIIHARGRIRNAVKSQGVKMPASASKLLGCDWDTFSKHLQSKFAPGMTFDNYGDWEVDHVKPISSFDLRDESQVRQCFSYLNTQPLWQRDNRAKGNKLIAHANST